MWPEEEPKGIWNMPTICPVLYCVCYLQGRRIRWGATQWTLSLIGPSITARGDVLLAGIVSFRQISPPLTVYLLKALLLDMRKLFMSWVFVANWQPHPKARSYSVWAYYQSWCLQCATSPGDTSWLAFILLNITVIKPHAWTPQMLITVLIQLWGSRTYACIFLHYTYAQQCITTIHYSWKYLK